MISRHWSELVRAAADPASIEDRDALLRRAVALGHQVAPGSAGCSVTSLDGDRYLTPVSSDPLAFDLDQAQYRSGDGPCMAAAREHRFHTFDAATDAGRFPGFAEAATGRGVHTSISLPLSGTVQPAALNLYGRTPHTFDAEHPRAVAGLLARCVSAVLAAPAGNAVSSRELTPQEAVPADEPPAGLAAARQRAALLAAAEAALMRAGSVSRTDALDLLMRRSRTEVRSIFDIAREVLAEPEGTLP